MFFTRPERKRHSALATLIVGALATVGAITLIKNGKESLKNAGCKIKSFFGNDMNLTECDN